MGRTVMGIYRIGQALDVIIDHVDERHRDDPSAAHAHIFINNQLARTLTIDPTRRSQPLYQRPGKPT